jgi:hypothetical protein
VELYCIGVLLSYELEVEGKCVFYSTGKVVSSFLLPTTEFFDFESLPRLLQRSLCYVQYCRTLSLPSNIIDSQMLYRIS